MTKFAKLQNNILEYAPLNKGNILNYNSISNIEMLFQDGYKEFISIDKPDTDRKYTIGYEETEDSITEIINYLESEEEYTSRKNNEELIKRINTLNANIQQLDLKRIRAICEPSVKDETTGETWLDYYNLQVATIREELSELQAGVQNDIT